MAASAAAALRVFLRRRAGAPAPASPSLPLLQPLFSGGRYSEQARSPLQDAAAAGLPESRGAQNDPAAVPSLLRRYSGKGYEPTPPWKPTNRQGMWGLKQVATAASNLPDKRRIQLSSPPMLSLIHQYSSKGGGLPRWQQPINRQVMQNLKQGEQDCYTIAYNKAEIVEWFQDRLDKDVVECMKTMREGLDTYGKGSQLLKEGLDSQAFAMFEKGLADNLKGINAYEKWLEYFAATIGNSKRLPPNMLKQNRKFYKDMVKFHKFARKTHKKLSSSFETVKYLKKVTKVLNAVCVGLGACILLLLMFNFGIYLA